MPLPHGIGSSGAAAPGGATKNRFRSRKQQENAPAIVMQGTGSCQLLYTLWLKRLFQQNIYDLLSGDLMNGGNYAKWRLILHPDLNAALERWERFPDTMTDPSEYTEVEGWLTAGGDRLAASPAPGEERGYFVLPAGECTGDMLTRKICASCGAMILGCMKGEALTPEVLGLFLLEDLEESYPDQQVSDAPAAGGLRQSSRQPGTMGRYSSRPRDGSRTSIPLARADLEILALDAQKA